MEEKKGKMDIKDNHPKSSTTNPKCLELAVEVDQYTRNTFSSNTSATNWAHAIIAGVSQVYASEVNLNISIVSTIIWQTQDPYDSYVNDASNMLSASDQFVVWSEIVYHPRYTQKQHTKLVFYDFKGLSFVIFCSNF